MRAPLSLLLVLLLGLAACTSDAPEGPEAPEPAVEAPDADGALVVYSGRSEALVAPIIERFTADTGIEVEVRYGDTAALAVQLQEEGAQSPADVFWAQDAGALGAVGEQLRALPDTLLSLVPEPYRSPSGRWVATSGRARVLAYSPTRADTTALPASVFDLTDAAYSGRVGWAPTNGSFQAFVTAMRRAVGDDSTRAWLTAMRDNGAVAYGNNRAILDGIAAGEVDLGLPNHYYLLRKLADDPSFPVAQTQFAAGDVGNLVNVAGLGILETASRPAAARRLIAYLLAADAQAYFAEDTREYAVTGPEGFAPAGTPDVDLDRLGDLEATLALLRDVGLL